MTMAANNKVQTPGCSEGRIRGLQEQVRELEVANEALRRVIAERVKAEAALRAGEAELSELIETLPQIVWITRPDGWHVHFNRQWTDFTGLTLEESLGHGWNPPFHPDDRDIATARWAEATRTGQPYEIEYRLRRADGVYHWMLGRAMPLRDASGTIVKWFGTCTDIEELKTAQARADDQARLLDQAQDAIVVHELDHRVTYWNQGAERVHGWTAAEAVGRSLHELVCRDMAQVDAALAVLLRCGEWRGELSYVDKAGAHLIMEGRWTLLRYDDDSPRAVLAVNTDVTERRKVEAALLRALEEKATHDPLTGLANRGLLFDRLELLLSQRDWAGTAVAFIDLDGLKPINDRLGHRAGDKVLVRVGQRLQGAVRQGDVVARVGGDEFVVVAQAGDEQATLQLGERLAAAVGEKTQIGGCPVRVSASVGVVFVSSGEDSTADDVLSRADAVMYDVKRRFPGSAALEQRGPATRSSTDGRPTS